jgi:hypothetical protein
MAGMSAVRPSRRLVALLAAVGVAVGLPAVAQGPRPPAHTGLFEQQLTDDARYAEGEPSIAVNPRNEQNIIVTFLANTGFGTYGVQNNTAPSQRDFEQTIQGCDYMLTFDGGRTWKRDRLPITNFDIDPTRPNCSDTLVMFDKRGVAYVVGSSYQFPTFTVGQGDFRLISSKDGGRTWSEPSVVSPTLLSPGADYGEWKGARFYDDREFMTIDNTTRTIYIVGTQGRLDASGTAGDIEYLTASRDGGKTWSDAIAVGSASFSPPGAAFGTVGLTSAPPTGADRPCNCLDFVVSTDRARTVVRRPTHIPLAGASPLSGAATAADPTHRNHFAVLSTDGDDLVVYRTRDAGRSWTKPSHLSIQGRGVAKPWMEYSASGVLGVGWRGTTDDGGYGFYAAFSTDHGRHWAIRRISRADSPSNDQIWVAGDDTSAVTLTDTMLFATWGDWRGHELHTWWGGTPLPR